MPTNDQRKDRKEGGKSDKPFKRTTKDSMVISTTPLKIIGKNKKKEEEKFLDRRQEKGKEVEREMSRPTFKELEERVYPFPDFDIANMLDELLKNKLIELPECKQSEKIGKVNGPKYYQYHRIVSHPIEKCFVLKENIMGLARAGKILLDDEVEESNHIVLLLNFLTH